MFLELILIYWAAFLPLLLIIFFLVGRYAVRYLRTASSHSHSHCSFATSLSCGFDCCSSCGYWFGCILCSFGLFCSRAPQPQPQAANNVSSTVHSWATSSVFFSPAVGAPCAISGSATNAVEQACFFLYCSACSSLYLLFSSFVLLSRITIFFLSCSCVGTVSCRAAILLSHTSQLRDPQSLDWPRTILLSTGTRIFPDSGDSIFDAVQEFLAAQRLQNGEDLISRSWSFARDDDEAKITEGGLRECRWWWSTCCICFLASFGRRVWRHQQHRVLILSLQTSMDL